MMRIFKNVKMNVRRMILFIIMLAFSYRLPAQTFDEWFHQKKTQIKYLLQQVAANEVYIAYLQKGYKIAESGLKTINNFKHGNYNLHNDFFNSLRNVSPKIKGMAEVAGIIALQVQIIKQAKSAVQSVKMSDKFTSAEVTYLQNVFNHLLNECTKDVNALIDIVTSDKLTMTDDERIRKVDAIYSDMQNKFSFTKSFSSEAILLTQQRTQEEIDVKLSKKLYGIQ